MRELNDPKELLEIISSKKTVLAKFYASWCHHCAEQQTVLLQMEPMLKNRNIEVVSLEADRAGDIGEKVNAYPTLMIIVDGKPRSMVEGMHNEKQIVKWLTKFGVL